MAVKMVAYGDVFEHVFQEIGEGLDENEMDLLENKLSLFFKKLAQAKEEDGDLSEYDIEDIAKEVFDLDGEEEMSSYVVLSKSSVERMLAEDHKYIKKVKDGGVWKYIYDKGASAGRGVKRAYGRGKEFYKNHKKIIHGAGIVGAGLGISYLAHKKIKKGGTYSDFGKSLLNKAKNPIETGRNVWNSAKDAAGRAKDAAGRAKEYVKDTPERRRVKKYADAVDKLGNLGDKINKKYSNDEDNSRILERISKESERRDANRAEKERLSQEKKSKKANKNKPKDDAQTTASYDGRKLVRIKY